MVAPGARAIVIHKDGLDSRRRCRVVKCWTGVHSPRCDNDSRDLCPCGNEPYSEYLRAWKLQGVGRSFFAVDGINQCRRFYIPKTVLVACRPPWQTGSRDLWPCEIQVQAECVRAGRTMSNLDVATDYWDTAKSTQ